MGQPLHFTIELPAPRERVWSCMLDDAGYRDWTSAFCEGSCYEGEWRTGASIRFLGPDGGSGMRARIETADYPSYVSIEHLGEIREGQPVSGPDWVGAYERYRLTTLPNGHTRLDVDLSEVPDAYLEMMNTAWPRALERLRALCAG